MKGHTVRLAVLVTFVTAVCLGCVGGEAGGSAESPPPGADGGAAEAPRNNQGYQYVAPDPAAYTTEATIEGWVSRFDTDAIEAHAWGLWAAINAPSGQFHESGASRVEIAVWETWFDEFETFHFPPIPCNAADCEGAMRLGGPRQQAAHDTQVLSFNKFSLEFVDWINKHRLFDEQTLIDLNQKFDQEGTPLDQRFVPFQDLDPKATMLKPSFWVVKPDQPSPMQYWKGPGVIVDGTLDPQVPIPPTWTQIVVVDPTGTAKPGIPYTIDVKSSTGVEKMTFADYEIVGLDRFYWVPLDAEDVAFLKAGNVFILNGVPVAELEEGDLALLVALHLTTAEFSDWTWQSFWWSPHPSTKAPPTVKPPFNNYELTQAYYMLGPDGAPHISMNPYLEPPDEGPIFMDRSQLGVKSNCMTCHHVAAFPTMNRDKDPATMLLGSYVATGQISGTEQYFQDRVKTRFMWSMVDFNQQQGKIDG